MKNKKTILIVLAILAVVVIASGCLAKFYVFAQWKHSDIRLNIAAGCDVRQAITSQLGASFGDKVYNLWHWQGGEAANAYGSYIIKTGDEAVRVARRIAHGNQTPIRMTFNNMRTFKDFSSRIASQMEFDEQAFTSACDSILPGRGFNSDNYISAFLPDTYEFYWTASPATVIEKLMAERDKFWNDSRKAKAEALGLTPNEIHILTSIAASESNKSNEWGPIARLYLNRIGKGMLLQADPTVVFATGDFSIRRVTGTHLRTDSPYNTYIYKGLPPGPIRMVDRQQLDEVLNSEANDYLYMCAKPDFSGYHNFAKDYNRHRLNAALYYRALEARGI